MNIMAMLHAQQMTLIAPMLVIELVSCKSCTTGCNNNRCACKRDGEPCTDFCGCDDSCENMDGAYSNEGQMSDDED